MLGRFAWVTVATAAPLVFVGGLVTSTQSGMAVPDWPNTYGSNMFLYPLRPATNAGVFLEHSHRLFGTLLGLSCLTLLIWTIRRDPRTWVKVWAVNVFALICVQGVLGGLRVNMNKIALAMIHGISAQVILAMLVGLGVFMSVSYRSVTLEPASPAPASARRLKLFATLAMHSTLLQLVFGAMYRHMRSPHALWSHIGFSVIVVIGAAMAGILATTMTGSRPIEQTLRRVGPWAFAVVVLQFLLGWLAFLLGGKASEPASIGQALLRTFHQANGALLIGIIAALFLFARHLWKSSARETTPAR